MHRQMLFFLCLLGTLECHHHHLASLFPLSLCGDGDAARAGCNDKLIIHDYAASYIVLLELSGFARVINVRHVPTLITAKWNLAITRTLLIL